MVNHERSTLYISKIPHPATSAGVSQRNETVNGVRPGGRENKSSIRRPLGLSVSLYIRSEALQMSTRQLFAAVFFLTLTYAVAKGDTGTASWYGSECAGKIMANGQPFNPKAITAAAWGYPLGTRLLVTNLANGRTVEVPCLDRGPAKRLHRIIDLSESAFKQIADTRTGLITVTISRCP
jgi:rare lipoprotein A